MVDYCHEHLEEEENFFLIPTKSIQASDRDGEKNHERNVLDTSYDTKWLCKIKGTHITLEPDYKATYLKGRGINQVHISFGNGGKLQYYFIIQSSDDNNNFVNLTGTLMSSAKTDALEPFYLSEEIKPKYIRIIFNGNNRDSETAIFTIELVNAKIEPYGKSYVINNS